MTEQRPPDEEPIIELTEVVEPSAAGDEDIIELTEVVASPAPSKALEDEEVIELTDVVDTPPAEEEILDLVDVVEAGPIDDAAAIDAAAVTDAEGPAETEAEQVGLLEEDLAEVKSEEPEGAAFDLFADTAPEKSETADSGEADEDDDLDFAPMDLDIEENKEEDLFDSLGMKLEPELQESEAGSDLDFNLSTQELSDAIDLLDAKLAEEPPLDTPADTAPAAALPTTVSEAQLESALENVIRKMFAEKIDMLINAAIEKNVTAEIEHLKNQLLKDSTEE
ncbi:MAG: hypothetical protein QNJ48_12420 [Desulfobacterales bacterium]|nr:hypothetical protein [Desulfobacterales bacterium]